MEVLVENSQKKEWKGGKLTDRWLGPYAINRKLGKGVRIWAEKFKWKASALLLLLHIYNLLINSYLSFPIAYKTKNGEMGTPQFGDPSPHIPSDVRTLYNSSK